MEIVMPHLLGLVLALCTSHHCDALPLQDVQLKLTPTRVDVCLLQRRSKQASCIGASAPDQWVAVHAIAQTLQRFAALVTHDARDRR
ncbi:hypothetical protein XVE_4463 [Xanthomonas vesicatoria ATCC 35937]|uniref:Uncharacterized protein n=2 Tax=Xanthomonas vesicatoria TaxID=56460 RepID=F0BJK3_9XANT|nr:hypothetical protein XVE_4463 [Xanthomonas vesicatoria ATCC 35937]